MSSNIPPQLIKRRRRTNPGQGESSREASCESNDETTSGMEDDTASLFSVHSSHHPTLAQRQSSFEQTSIPNFSGPPAATGLTKEKTTSKRHPPTSSPTVQSPNGPPISILGRPLPETDGEGEISEGSAGHDGDISSATASYHRSPTRPSAPVLTTTLPTPTTLDDSTPPSPSSTSSASLLDLPTSTAAPGVESRHPGHGPKEDPLWAAAPQGFLSNLTANEIQEHIKKAIEGAPGRSYKIKEPPTGRPVRIYADGVYDLFHYGHMLQLRQCKLAFPSVHLLVGVCSSELVLKYKATPVLSSDERYESVRHCKWVDEVVEEAPWEIDEAFMKKWKIDYVAHDEEPYKSAGKDDTYWYPKSIGAFLPTKRTNGVSTSELLQRIVEGYREGDYDSKFIKLGLPELCSTRQGSEAGTTEAKAEVEETVGDETLAGGGEKESVVGKGEAEKIGEAEA